MNVERRGIEITPPASLAYRVEVRGKERRYVGPEIGNLCNEFFDGRKPGFVPKSSKLVAFDIP